MRRITLLLGLLVGLTSFIAACNEAITDTPLTTVTILSHQASPTPVKIERPTPTPKGWTVEDKKAAKSQIWISSRWEK